LQSISIPASVEILGGDCFSNCTSLSRFTIESPLKMTEIYAGAFSGCSSLTAICIPASVSALYAKCFSECKSLSSLAFGSGSQLRQIHSHAFSGCLSLNSLFVPASVCRLEDGWSEQSSLSQLTFQSASSFGGMIERRAVDLSRIVEINIARYDCKLAIEGY
jgi:hypothetical protein